MGTELRLRGVEVVVTRSARSAPALSTLLELAGATAIEMPLIAMRRPPNLDELSAALGRISAGDLVAVTSVHGAAALLEYASERPDEGVSVAAVGEATADVLAGTPWGASIVPAVHTARSLASEVGSPRGSGRVVYVAAGRPRPEFQRLLVEAGWVVDHVEAYSTEVVTPLASEVDLAASCDVITFTSGSTVKGWQAVVGDRTTPSIVTMGPATTEAALDLGFTVAAQARHQSLDGLVEAVVEAGAP